MNLGQSRLCRWLLKETLDLTKYLTEIKRELKISAYLSSKIALFTHLWVRGILSQPFIWKVASMKEAITLLTALCPCLGSQYLRNHLGGIRSIHTALQVCGCAPPTGSRPCSLFYSRGLWGLHDDGHEWHRRKIICCFSVHINCVSFMMLSYFMNHWNGV